MRLAAVATSICLTATGLAFAWNHWSTPALRPAPWWLVTIVGSGFAFAQIAQFSVVVGKERLNFVFAEIPAAFALVYLAPWQMALSWLIGPVMVQAFQHRTVWFKLVFNGSANLVRAGAAIGLIRLWDTAALSAADLVRIALAIAVAEAFASTIASAFIRWASGRKPRAAAMDVTVATGQSVVGASLGAWALLAADEHPALLALPAVVVALIWQFARQQWADRQAYQDLLEVHGFLTTVAGIEARDVAADGLQRLRTILGCTWIALVDDGGEPVEGAGRLPDGIGDLVDLEVEERARRSLLSCPLRNGRVILAGPPAAGGSYTRRDRRRFQTAADLFDAALERAELQLKLEHDATHDPLTDLLARGGFTRAADRILNGRSGHGAVIVVDLARFTEVNNTLGFKAGDILLRQTAERLTDVLGEHRVVARLDGDAFAVFLPLDDADAILGIAGQLRQALQEPIRVRGLGLSLLVRLGIAVGPGHGTTSESLLRAADVAAELARDAQPPIVIYRAEADLHSESRLELLSRVRRALETEAFEVWYQPKVDTISGLVVGVEALVRWFDDGRWISPDEFIPTAEAAGMMSELTHHVLRNALAVVARLRHRGFELSVAVNLSPSTLEDPGLHDRIVAELTRFGIQPPSLTVEITESVVMGTGEVAAGALQRLRQLGVRLSVDDFGTGYSSLRYLKELDVDELKLDRSFVQDLDVSDRSERIARAVIGLGHTLGLRVVAEGVETPNARAMLQQMGCDVLQGYLIGRPMDAERLEEWLRRHKSAARPGRDQEPTPSDRRPVGRSDS